MTDPATSRLQQGFISSESRAALRRDAEALNLRIQDVAREISEHEARIGVLVGQRDRLTEALRNIELLTLPASAEDRPIDSVPVPPSSRQVEAQIAPGSTLADRIEELLAHAGTPLHYREILERLQDGGAAIGGKDPAATLLSVLASKRYEGRFARYGRGVYTLSGLAIAHTPSRPSKRRRRRPKH